MKSTYEQILVETAERRKHLRQLCSELFGTKIITLEVGCGHGHFLTSYAKLHSEKVCVGIDILGKRILLGEKKQEREALKNLYFLKAEATEFLESLPKTTFLDTIFILFPDPWPKKRHHKHRIIQEPFLKLLANKSLVGAYLYFRTDSEDYFDWAREALEASKDWQIWSKADWPFEEETVFQKKAQAYQSLIAVKKPSMGTDGLNDRE